MKKLYGSLAAMLLVLTLALTGCTQQPKPGSSSTQQGTVKPAKPQTEKPQAPAQMSTRIYFPNENGSKLLPVAKNVRTEAKYQDAIEALIKGVQGKGMTGMFPKGVKLRSITVKNGLATVDFSQELTKKFVGGSTGELMLVGSIVQTLTEFPEVKKVQLTVEGKVIESISGHLDISEPFVRNDKQLEL